MNGLEMRRTEFHLDWISQSCMPKPFAVIQYIPIEAVVHDISTSQWNISDSVYSLA